MNTKSALIIAVAIVIGFSIEPILDRVDFSDPKEKVVEVLYDKRVKTFRVAGTLEWKISDGVIFANASKHDKYRYTPANQYSAEIGYQLVQD